MSHYKESFSKATFGRKGEVSWIKVRPFAIKPGQCIYLKAHIEEVHEAIRLLFLGTQERNELAQKNSDEGLFFIVTRNPEAVKGGVKLTLLHCTTSTLSRHFADIARPFPHQSNLWKSENVKRQPLAVKEGSLELPQQTYVIPYKEIEVVQDENSNISVLMAFQATDKGVSDVLNDIEENKRWFKQCQEEINDEASAHASTGRPSRQEEDSGLDPKTKAALEKTISEAKMPDKSKQSAELWSKGRQSVVSPPESPLQRKQSTKQSSNTTEQPKEAGSSSQAKNQNASAKHWANFKKESLSED